MVVLQQLEIFWNLCYYVFKYVQRFFFFDFVAGIYEPLVWRLVWRRIVSILMYRYLSWHTNVGQRINFQCYKVVQIWPGRFVCKQVSLSLSYLNHLVFSALRRTARFLLYCCQTNFPIVSATSKAFIISCEELCRRHAIGCRVATVATSRLSLKLRPLFQRRKRDNYWAPVQDRVRDTQRSISYEITCHVNVLCDRSSYIRDGGAKRLFCTWQCRISYFQK